MSVYSKCPICRKGSGFIDCCGHNKETGEKIKTLWVFLSNLFKSKKNN